MFKFPGLMIRRATIVAVGLVALQMFASVSFAAERGFLGMEVQGNSPKISAALGLQSSHGVLVKDISLDGPASHAGINRGDLITSFDGKEIDTFERLLQIASGLKPGAKVDVEVLRVGAKHNFTMTLAAWPEAWQVKDQAFAAQPDLGVTLAAMTPKVRLRLGIRWSSTGIVVSIANDSFAGVTPLRRGDIVTQINQRPVWNPKQFIDAYAEAKKEGRPSILLLVERASGFRYMIQPILNAEAGSDLPPLLKLPGQQGG